MCWYITVSHWLMGRIDHCKYVYISLVISGFTCHHTASRFLFHEQADIGTDTSMAFFFLNLQESCWQLTIVQMWVKVVHYLCWRLYLQQLDIVFQHFELSFKPYYYFEPFHLGWRRNPLYSVRTLQVGASEPLCECTRKIRLFWFSGPFPSSSFFFSLVPFLFMNPAQLSVAF